MNENLSLKAKIYHYAVLFLVFLFLALPLMATIKPLYKSKSFDT